MTSKQMFLALKKHFISFFVSHLVSLVATIVLKLSAWNFNAPQANAKQQNTGVDSGEGAWGLKPIGKENNAVPWHQDAQQLIASFTCSKLLNTHSHGGAP